MVTLSRILLLLILTIPLAQATDLSKAIVVLPLQPSALESKAATVLIEEIEKRSQVRLAIGPASATSIVFGRRTGPAEGFSISTSGSRIEINSSDGRGALYGAGYLLRKLDLSRQHVELPAAMNITSAPQTKLRGHQLGYRPKTNSYDAWNVAMWEQYIRDLAIFGTNAIELIPPRSDDDDDSPHFPKDKLAMMIEMSRLGHEYGMDVWAWYPALDKDYGDPATVAFALKEWADVVSKLPYLDALFVPGGDPGHTEPRHLMNLLEKQKTSLRRFHPKLQMWMAPQGFDKDWRDQFYALLNQQPAWLDGLVHGPQMHMTLAEFRNMVPARYPIRTYPDITHSRQAQYLVPNWDLAFASTLGREPINPRPVDQAIIFRAFNQYTIGFLTYSEGCNDDVNKFVWSGLGWDNKLNIIDLLRDYSRYFIGSNLTDGFAQGLLSLENNWRGPLLTNANVGVTLTQFQQMERASTPQQKLNWRFQQALYRAYYDAYTRSRLLYESSLEEQATARLREAPQLTALVAINEAERILERGVLERTASTVRARVFELAEALYQSIRMQLHVERYGAIAVNRGASLNTIDFPLNNIIWMKDRFAAIRNLPNERDRQAQIRALVEYENPGPGGFYDDLGNLSRQPHLILEPGFEKDPSHSLSAFAGSSNHNPDGLMPTTEPRFAISGLGVVPQGRRSLWDTADTFYDAPLRMRYTGLDPQATYKIKVTYGGDMPKAKIRLVANGKYEIHTYIVKEFRPVEFEIPMEATAGGVLELSFTREPGGGGSGRGCQVAEVWLMRR